jgi:hypothetical protein
MIFFAMTVSPPSGAACHVRLAAWQVFLEHCASDLCICLVHCDALCRPLFTLVVARECGSCTIPQLPLLLLLLLPLYTMS